LGMFMHADKIQGGDMPTIFFPNELSPMVGYFMVLALLGMIFNTAVGMLYAFTARFIQPERPRFTDNFMVIALFAFGVCFIGFVELVGSVLPITGYLGFVLILAIVLSWISSRRKKDSGKDGNWTKVM